MPRPSQFRFLGIFLTILTIVIVGVLVLRVRSYARAASPNAEVAEGDDTATVSGGSDGRLPVRDPRLRTLDAVTAQDTAGATTGAAQAQAKTRSQRFRELLALSTSQPLKPPQAAAAPSPKGAPIKPPPAPPKQSVLARLVQPLVNAFSSKPTTPPGVTPSSGGSSKTTTSGDQTTRDPNSDTTPPQLISIEFKPPEVHDGEETQLIINATDDLSGIRGISGTITNPTGKAVQGFAQQRDGETTRYISRLLIPKDAEAGIWKISFLNMTDNATNTVTLTAAQGGLPPTAVLRVTSSHSDSTPPTLRNVWIDKRAMRAGEHNTLFVDAQDDNSGVHLVAAVFVSPKKFARLGVGCQKGQNDIWQCDFFPPVCLDCGDWTLEQVQMQDNANNFATVRDNPLIAQVTVNIIGDSCDSAPPVLQGLTLDRDSITMGRDEPVINVTATVTDDNCGVGGVSGQVVGPGTSTTGTYFSFQQLGDNIWKGTIRLDTHVARGTWHVQSITVTDKGQNLRTYYANDPLLGRTVFQVR